MNPSRFYFGGDPPPPQPPPPPPSQSKPPQPPPPKKKNQIQGPRPTALKVHQDSHKIKKPPIPPAQQPVIIYAVSPKVIHTEVSDFMAVVQRLTGLSSGNFSGDGEISPAARLAATEKVSPRERNPNINTDESNNIDLLDMVEGVEISQMPGILSPAPTMLSPIPSGFFSPAIDPNFFNDVIISPYGNSSFVVSPSGLLPTSSLVSPLPSPDIFSLFMEF